MSTFFPSTIFYGADYNPEQWPEAVWQDDMRLMKQASVNLVSINIFSWALLVPEAGKYHFEQLDRIMDLLAEHQIGADLATGTASPPPWMSRLYPTMLPVTRSGVRMSQGSRQHYCPNSLDYRQEAEALVSHLAERYAKHPALKMWHVNNEYACHTQACYCNNCAAGFRNWLQKRYSSLARLNAAWATNFWSQHYTHWDEILPPRIAPAQTNPTQMLDYQRFMSDSFLECFLIETRVLRKVTPDIPLTTNLMVAFKPLDYFEWAKHMDVISFDQYPHPINTPAWEVAMTNDLMRSLKHGQPYIVMEQSPSQVNWQPQNPHKRPGQSRLQNFQALAHGADGLLYFQWRQSQGGAEKFHSAIVNHDGSDQSRIFKQAAQIGDEARRLAPDVVGSRMPAQVALLMDWHNWWAVEYLPGPSDRLKYWEQLKSYYRPLHALNVGVDIVAPDRDLSGYGVVVAPLLYMLRPGVAQNLTRYVEKGGTLITTFFSGIVNQDDHVTLGGYPGELRKLLGIRVEEFDPWTEAIQNEVVIEQGALAGRYPCTLWGELVHLEGAKALGVFRQDYYAQGPAITEHAYGKGKA
ncbi:MAG TPA: beta-galactosidase, partial [Ktedonobacteraceae bacterium]|nr:beta-galactosidase [Ktedonobacteraceae bacterium]